MMMMWRSTAIGTWASLDAVVGGVRASSGFMASELQANWGGGGEVTAVHLVLESLP